MRATSLDGANTNAIAKDIGSKYDNVKTVADNIADVVTVANTDFTAIAGQVTQVANDVATSTTNATNAATSEANALVSENNAKTSETNSLANELLAADWAEKADGLDVNGVGTRSSKAHASHAQEWAESSVAVSVEAGGDGTTSKSAKTLAGEASVSATNAATSEANGATSATNASNSETNAATYASNALTSETNAAASASNALTSETNAATSASNASTSATNASTSETNAATSASNALTSETNAAASEAKITGMTVATGAPGTSATWDGVNGILTVPEGIQGVQGIQGVAGFDGKSVQAVTKTAGTGASGTIDTYTMWEDVAATVAIGTFDVYNGTDGTGAGDMLKTTYDTTNTGVVDNAELVNGLTVGTAVPAGAVFTDTTYGQVTTTVDGLMIAADKSKLDGVATGAQVNDVNTTLQGNTFNGAYQLVQLGATGALPAVDGSALTGITTATTTVDALTDTTITTPAAGEVLSYDATNSVWVNSAPSGTGDMLKSVYDTTASGVVDNAELVNGLTVATAVPSGAVFTDTTYGQVTTTVDGLMIAADKSKLDGIASGAQVNDVATTLQGNTFNGASQLVQLDAGGLLPAVDGSQLLNVSSVAGITDLTDVDTTTVTPVTNDRLCFDGTNWVPTQNYYNQATAPTSPIIGDEWYDTSVGTLYKYVNDGTADLWVDISTSGAGGSDVTKQTYADFNSDGIVSGFTIATSASLSSTVLAGVGYVGGNRVTIADTTKTFTASTDTYVDIDNLGTLVYTEVANGATEPAITSPNQRVAKVTTDATTVAAVLDMRFFATLNNNFNYSTITANYTAVVNDYINIDSSAGVFTITLPATHTANDTIVCNTGQSVETNVVDVQGNGSNILFGNLTDTFINLDKNTVEMKFKSNGTNWEVL